MAGEAAAPVAVLAFDSGARLVVEVVGDHIQVTFGEAGDGFGCSEDEAEVLIRGLSKGLEVLKVQKAAAGLDRARAEVEARFSPVTRKS